MADNLAYTPGAGATVATDDIGGIHYQRVKPSVGIDGAAADVSAVDPMPVSDRVTTATRATVASAMSVQTLRASNAARRGLFLVNDSTSLCYVKLGSAASASDWDIILPGKSGDIRAYWWFDPPIYTGIVTGLWVTADGQMRVVELTA